MTNFYSPQHDRGLLWNDPALGIDWQLPNPAAAVLSGKDKAPPDPRGGDRPVLNESGGATHPIGIERSRAAHRSVRDHNAGSGNRAVTRPAVPPRTAKSPTTVIRFGFSTATKSSRTWLTTPS